MNPGPRPIFVVGFQRSGTTLLQAMLGAHSAIVAAPELHFWLRLHGMRDYWGDLSDDASVRRAVGEMVTLPGGLLARAGFDADRISAAVIRGERSYRSLLQAALDELAGRSGKQRWSEKTPGQTAAQIWELFPEAQVIHIVRDPRKVVASARSMPYCVESTWRLARDWKTFTLANIRAGADKGPDHFLQIRYEDLASDPLTTVRILCAFLEEPFETAMVTVAGRRRATALLGSARPWQQSAFGPIHGPDTSPVRSLSAADRCRVGASVAGVVGPLGYVPSRAKARIAGAILLMVAAPRRLIAALGRVVAAARIRTPEDRQRALAAFVAARAMAGSHLPDRSPETGRLSVLTADGPPETGSARSGRLERV